jgi:glycosyltransferase involved in cell wall biosynthesis
VGLIAPHGVSGVSSAMARLAALDAPHYPWRVLAIGPGPIAAGGLPGADTPGFDTLSWPPGTRAVEQIRLVRDRLRAMGATVVSPNFLVQGFVAAALDRHRGRRIAAIFHGSELAAEDLYMRVAPLCDAWRAVSPAIARRVARYAGSGAAPPSLPTGTEVPAQWTPPPCTRSRHEPLRLLYAGWLDERVKRVMDLVPLADALHRLGVHFRLTIAGRGPAAKALAVAMAGHIVAGRVHLAGPVPHAEMDGLNRDHDVLVLVSQMEGTPTVVMEAMARARPVAITRGCGGALEAVKDGEQGVVVDVGDMETLAKRLADLNGRRADLAKMGERARVGALEHFDIRALAARFDHLIDEAAAAANGPSSPAEIAALWMRLLPAIEYLGETTPEELEGLAVEWLADMGATAVRHAAGGSPGRVADGAMVITPAPDEARRLWGDRVHLLPLVMPRVVNFASRRTLAALGELRARGCSRIVLYGAGKHTAKLGAAIEGARDVVGIVDDRAGAAGGGGPPEWMWGLPVVKPRDAAGLGFDAVIVSSDEYERVMLPRAREWAGGKPVAALYAPIETPGGEIPEALIATPPSPRV